MSRNTDERRPFSCPTDHSVIVVPPALTQNMCASKELPLLGLRFKQPLRMASLLLAQELPVFVQFLLRFAIGGLYLSVALLLLCMVGELPHTCPLFAQVS